MDGSRTTPGVCAASHEHRLHPVVTLRANVNSRKYPPSASLASAARRLTSAALRPVPFDDESLPRVVEMPVAVSRQASRRGQRLARSPSRVALGGDSDQVPWCGPRDAVVAAFSADAGWTGERIARRTISAGKGPSARPYGDQAQSARHRPGWCHYRPRGVTEQVVVVVVACDEVDDVLVPTREPGPHRLRHAPVLRPR